jgi:hypothetical protein
MDQVRAGFCSPGALRVTRRPVAPVLREGLAEGGIEFDHQCVAPGEAGTLEGLVLRDETALARVRRCGGLLPYAVLPDTEALAERTGHGDRLPPAATVATVNSKSWSHDLVARAGLPGAGVLVRSVDELRAAAADVGGAVVVKDPFGVSGRATLEVGTPGVLRAVTRTLQRQVDRGLRVELLVQPKYDKRADFSAHLRITAGGGWNLVAVQGMHNRGFRHIGSGPAGPDLLDALDRAGYTDVLAVVAAALADAGYTGPAGVDSMLLADGTVLPVLEVNARLSLGLLSIVLDRRVREHGLRCHLWQVEVQVPPGHGVAALVGCLRRADALYTGGGRPGVVVLTGSGLAAPGGRVYCGLMCEPDAVTSTRTALLAVLAEAGLPARGVVDAA